MKKIMVILGVLGGLMANSAYVQANDLDRTEIKAFLFAVDQICADTWCEGDYNFRFTGVDCDFSEGRCQLSYDAGIWPNLGQRWVWSRHESCRISGVRSLSDLLTEQGNSQILSVQPYEQITQCIADQFLPLQAH
jgi:hypothetical protein